MLQQTSIGNSFSSFSISMLTFFNFHVNIFQPPSQSDLRERYIALVFLRRIYTNFLYFKMIRFIKKSCLRYDLEITTKSKFSSYLSTQICISKKTSLNQEKIWQLFISLIPLQPWKKKVVKQEILLSLLLIPLWII